MEKEEVNKILDNLTLLKDYLIKIPNYHQSVKNDIEYYTAETTDLLHDLEFCKLDRTIGSRKAKALQKNQRNRRESKNLHEITTVLNTFALNNKKLISDIQKVINQVQQIRTSQENRIYAPRAETSMEVAFRHYDTENERYN